MRVAVAGGTGLAGRVVCQALEDSGHSTIVLARATGVDLRTGAGLADQLSGVDAVIDCTNVQTTRARVSEAGFGAMARTLTTASADAHVGHYLALSIVGIDRVGLGYYKGKVVQEDVIRASSVPWTILRATQFHEFTTQLLQARGPVVPVPKMRSATVAIRDVATQFVTLLASGPATSVVEMRGPEVHAMGSLVRRVAKATGDKRPILDLGVPGSVGKAMSGDGLLPQGEAVVGSETFDEWLTRYTAERP